MIKIRLFVLDSLIREERRGLFPTEAASSGAAGTNPGGKGPAVAQGAGADDAISDGFPAIGQRDQYT